MARDRPEAMSTTPVESMTSVAAPPRARIWVGTTAGAQSAPSSHGTSTGAVIASIASSGNSTAVSSLTIWPRSSWSSSGPALRERTGNATVTITSLILR